MAYVVSDYMYKLTFLFSGERQGTEEGLSLLNRGCFAAFAVYKIMPHILFPSELCGTRIVFQGLLLRLAGSRIRFKSALIIKRFLNIHLLFDSYICK